MEGGSGRRDIAVQGYAIRASFVRSQVTLIGSDNFVVRGFREDHLVVPGFPEETGNRTSLYIQLLRV